jgi:lysylphosphatidylglycerol synthetase-like protein (DUF2156 family)
MKKIFLLFIVLLILPSVMAIQSLGTFQKDTNINLIQTCDNCTYVDVTKVQLPNSTIIKINKEMTKDISEYNYTFSQTDKLGEYIYTTCGDDDGVYTCASVGFEVTYTGEKVSLSNAVIVIAFLILAIICLVLGFSFKMDYWIVKSFFFFCSVLAGILAINSARIIASESTNLSKMGDMGLLIGIVLFALFFLFMFVFAFIEIIQVFKQKKKLRWEY